MTTDLLWAHVVLLWFSAPCWVGAVLMLSLLSRALRRSQAQTEHALDMLDQYRSLLKKEEG